MSFASPSAGLPVPPSPFSFGLDEPTQTYAWAGVVFVTVLVAYTTLWKGPYSTIPAIGGTGFISSYVGALQLVKNGKEVVQAGYNRYKPGVFRIPQMNRWLVIVSGEELVEELRKAPDDTLCFPSAIEETLQSRYSLGPNILANRYHVGIVRGQLTRNLGTLFPDVHDEIVRAFEDIIPPHDEWSKVTAYAAVLQIVARTSNRIFVGAPLCRNPEYTKLNIRHTLDVSEAGRTLRFFPNFFKPLVASLLTNVPNSILLGLKHLEPLIKERQRKIDEYGLDYPEKPNDFLSWLMDEAEGEERTSRNLTNRILHVNFAAIHTSSMSFTHALFHMASQPEYMGPIRQEVETIIAREGWTKVAMTHMRKLDSFLKESQRMNGLNALSLTRKALKSFTFSNGTHLPKGSMVAAAAQARHYDEEVYTNGDTFNGFRFSNIRDQDGQGTKNQFVNTNPDYISFGHGRHACPGRFFAANELKAMMAHLILTYDIKMENEGVRPENLWFGFNCAPNSKAKVLFRCRQM